jgi:hypothetical protein
MRTFGDFIQEGAVRDIDTQTGYCSTTEGEMPISRIPVNIARPIALRVVEPLPESGFDRPLSFGVAQNAQRLAELAQPVLRLITSE